VSVKQCMAAKIFFTALTFVRTRSFRFLYVGIFENPRVCSAIWKWKDSPPTHFLCLWNNTQSPRDLWKGATVHDQTCPCVHWFRWRIFWAFVVNCDLIYSTNWTVVKLRTCIVNVLYQFYVKYYAIKVLPLTVTFHWISGHMVCIWTFFICLDVKTSPLKFVQAL